MTTLLLLLPMPEPFVRGFTEPIKARFPDLSVAWAADARAAAEHIGETEILFSFSNFMSDAVVRDAKRLRWIQSLGTGVDNIVDLPSLGRGVIVSNVRAIHGETVSELAIALMLSLARDIPHYVRSQDARTWAPRIGSLLDGKTAGLFGTGAIARTLAPRLKALGMTVVGITATRRAIPGFDRVHARAELDAVIGGLDYLIVLSPLTDQTRGLVGAETIGRMKPSAYLVNLGRGGVVDEAALLAALREQRIAGAALDVFDAEPLDAGHPFWRMDNVIVTPHAGGLFAEYPERALPTVLTNLDRFLAGDSANMINVLRC